MEVRAITLFAQGSYLFVYSLWRSAVTTNVRIFSPIWISALPLMVLFAIGSTATNAQTRIGTVNSVKPEALGSIAGTLSAGSGVHANEQLKPVAPAKPVCSLTIRVTLVLERRHRYGSTSLFMIQTRAPAVRL
jgi:hypothetical protein